MDALSARSVALRSVFPYIRFSWSQITDFSLQCNEEHPTCSNCERRQIFCDFSLSPGESNSPSTDARGQTSQGGSSNGVHRTPTQPVIDPFLQPDLVSTKRSTTDLDVTDLRLMHHFTSVVALDLANAQTAEAEALWQVHAVKLGLKHEFLLRGILAVSAFHLAYIHPDRKSRIRAHWDDPSRSWTDIVSGHARSCRRNQLSCPLCLFMSAYCAGICVKHERQA